MILFPHPRNAACLATKNPWFQKAAVPESVVRDIIGHESELVSREYTHMDDETKRKAILKLPVLK